MQVRCKELRRERKERERREHARQYKGMKESTHQVGEKDEVKSETGQRGLFSF